MSRAEQLRADLVVAEFEEELAVAKNGDDPEHLAAVKSELRYARWVQRGGPAIEEELLAEHARLSTERDRLIAEHPEAADQLVPLLGPHTNRATEAHYQRWLAEQKG